MSRRPAVPTHLLAVGAVVLSGACSDSGGPPHPAIIAQLSGNHQTGPAGELLAQPIVVKVSDVSGAGVPNVTITWAVVDGGGALSAATTATDDLGVTAVTWTLGPAAGIDNNRVTASATGLDGSPATFLASGTANATIRGTVTVTSHLVPQLVSDVSGAGAHASNGMDAGGGSSTSWNPPHHAPVPGWPAEAGLDELIVTYRRGAVPGTADRSPSVRTLQAVGAVGSAVRDRLVSRLPPGAAEVAGVSPAILAARVRVPRERLADVAAALLRDPAVAVVERNALMGASPSSGEAVLAARPNDLLYPRQAWHFGMVDVPEAWAITTGSASVVVAVVSDGIRFDHPDVVANLTTDGFDFVSHLNVPVCGSAADSIDNAGDGDGYDADPTVPSSYRLEVSAGVLCVGAPRSTGGTGLALAGTLGAVGDNLTGVVGVNWNVRIRPVRIFGVMGLATFYDVAQGILYAAGLPADDGAGGTVQASTGSRLISLDGSGSASSEVLQNAVVAAHAAGALLVVSSGLSGAPDPQYPAVYPEVLSVSALLADGQLAGYSSFGPAVAVSAPGGDWTVGGADFGVMSTGWDFENSRPEYLTWRGTGMAVAHVSGIAALLLAQTPTLTREQLRSRLTAYAVDAGAPGRDDVYGAGIVNARNSLTQSLAPPQQIYVQLYDAASAALIETIPAEADGSYQFTGLPDGAYHVVAGQDENGDRQIGIPGRRWGAFGGPSSPTTVTVGGAGAYLASFPIGFPAEVEPNDALSQASALRVGAYVHGQVATQGSWDFFRIVIPKSGRYTVETSAWDGACGFALEENTILSLHDAAGSTIASNDDIDASALDYCSRITAALTSGTYYISVSGWLGRRYRASVREEP